jgi:hypothetical protein
VLEAVSFGWSHILTTYFMARGREGKEDVQEKRGWKGCKQSHDNKKFRTRSIVTVAYRGVGGGGSISSPEVLTKLSRIPSSVENISVTTLSEYGFHSFAN